MIFIGAWVASRYIMQHESASNAHDIYQYVYTSILPLYTSSDHAKFNLRPHK